VGRVSALDRDSAVKLRAMLEIPPGSFRLFLVASVLGTWVPVDGHPRKLKDGERCIATEVRTTHRDKALELLGYSPKTWANAVTEWIDRRLAHRCSKGVICLFTTPLGGDLAICPRCSASLSREPGRELPSTGEVTSPQPGSSHRRKVAASSANDFTAEKVHLQGGREGDVPDEELHRMESEALKNVYQVLRATRASA
jgi:hypothetical protein